MGFHLIRHEGLKPDFPWLPQTILNQDAYYDHHLLYHVYGPIRAATDPGVDGGSPDPKVPKSPASSCRRWPSWSSGGCAPKCALGSL
ncbi:MAG: hypothetical protein H6669_07855 [Ardenticatenaceae bacterium]|nr:hypothetical protein [Ardenticatenaceae bacterium]